MQTSVEIESIVFVSQQVTTTSISSTPSPDQAAAELTTLATTSGGSEPTDGAVATAGGGSSTSSSAASAPMLPPCRICGEKASGFHYGANTCEACKVRLRGTLTEYGCRVLTGLLYRVLIPVNPLHWPSCLAYSVRHQTSPPPPRVSHVVNTNRHNRFVT